MRRRFVRCLRDLFIAARGRRVNLFGHIIPTCVRRAFGLDGWRRIIQRIQYAGFVVRTGQNGEDQRRCKETRGADGRSARQGVCRLADGRERAHTAAASTDTEAAAFGALQEDKPDQREGQKKVNNKNDIFHGSFF